MRPKLVTLPREALSDRVYEAIKQRIIEPVYLPNQRLRQISGGFHTGSVSVYLKDSHGITLELFERGVGERGSSGE